MSAEAKIREQFDNRAKQEVGIFLAKKTKARQNLGKYKIGVRKK
jgi:hypothetical protein